MSRTKIRRGGQAGPIVPPPAPMKVLPLYPYYEVMENGLIGTFCFKCATKKVLVSDDIGLSVTLQCTSGLGPSCQNCGYIPVTPINLEVQS